MQTKPLRVIHFVHWPASGITEVIRQIVVSCKNDNVDYSVFLLTSDENFDSNFQWCSKRFQFFYDKNKLTALLKCLKAIRHSKPHIIHCHSISPALIACFLFRGKKIFHLHNEYPYLFENNFYYKVKRFTLIGMYWLFRIFFICVSNKVTNRLSELGISQAKFLPNCIEKVGPIKKINNEKLKSPIKAVTISRLHPQKNLLNCVEAIALLRERGCSISYHIYGKGELEEALAKKIHELNLSKQVILAGYTFNPAQVLVDFDVYLSGSVYEGFPLSLLQAMRARVPICSTNVGELVMNLSDGKDFFEIKGFSSEAIADSLERYCSATLPEIQAITENARDIFEKYYTADTFGISLNLIYRKLLGI